MKLFRVLAAACAAGVLAACAINTKVSPVGALPSNEICVVSNSTVRVQYRDAIVRNIQLKGYTVRVVEPTGTTGCQTAVNYTANWNWDLAMYLRRTEIMVMTNNVMTGHVLYDATMGGARPDKFVSADEKVAELVGKLFPEGPAR